MMPLEDCSEGVSWMQIDEVAGLPLATLIY